MHPVLELDRITKSFGDFLALDGAGFEVRRGEIHALLGENGAGKSSLMNVAAGLYAPDSGAVRVGGAEVRLDGPADARARRIGMVHQHFKLIGPFTVAENILLANPGRTYAAALRDIRAAVAAAGDRYGFALDPDRRIDDLSLAEQQRVEILKVLLGGAEVLILDEPTAVLTDAQSEALLGNLRQLADRGAAVVLVTHMLRDVIAYADRATVMRGGRTIGTVDPRSTSIDRLTEMAVGSGVIAPVRSVPPVGRDGGDRGRAMLYVAGLRCTREDGHVAVQDVTFAIRDHEIYGLAGVSGNGQSELAEALTGLRQPDAGSVEIAGAGAVTHAPPGRRRDLGLAAIPADRYADGLAGSLSVTDNLAVSGLRSGRFGHWFRVDRGAMRRAAATAVEAFDVQGVRGLAQKAALLSGGNAQKLLLARELGRAPAVVIAHGPSRGLDVRACAAVQERLLAARDAGAAVLLISDNVDEILALADRIGVMVRGRIVAEFEAPADRQDVGRAMVHHHA